MTEIKKTFTDPAVVKAKGVCPSEVTEDQLHGMHAVVARLSASLAEPSSDQNRRFYPAPLLERIPNLPIGWSGTEGQQARIFGHIFSGTYLKESGLEGSSFLNIAKYFEEWFHYFVTHSSSGDAVKFIQGITPQLQSLQRQQERLQKILKEGPSPENLRKAAGEWRKQVTDLADGEVYLMSGGWAGAPGHAMLYEFKRVGKTFEMRIFNTGAGTDKHHVVMIEGTKQKISPVLCKSGIPISALSLEFFQSVLEPQLIPFWNLSGMKTGSDARLEMIYRAFFALDGWLESSSGWITSQRAGTCAADSLFSYIRYRFGEDKLGLYEQIQLWLRIGTLAQAWESWKDRFQGEDFEKKSHFMSLLEKGAQRIISDSIKPMYFKENSWFAHVEMEQARALGLKVQLSLARMRSQIKETAQSQTENACLKDRNLPSSTYGVLKKAFIQKSSSESRLILFKANIHPISQPSECRAYLKAGLKAIQAECNSTNVLEIQTQLQWLVDSLPIPTNEKNDFWQQVPISDVTECIEMLDTIQALYFERLQVDALAVLPEEQNVFFALLTILHTLARREEELHSVPAHLSLDRHRIGDPTKILESDPYTVFFSPSTKERRQKILTYFSEYNRARVGARFLHNFLESFADFPADKPEKTTEEFRKRDEFQYYLDWIQSDSNLSCQIDRYGRSGGSITWEFNRFNDFSSDERYAFRLTFDPSSVFQKNQRGALAALRNAAIASHVLAGNWEEEKLAWGDNKIRCRLSLEFEGFSPKRRASYQFVLGEKKYEFLQKPKKEGFRSKLLHSSEPSIVKERKESEYALRSQLRTEGAALPSMGVRNAEEPNAQPLHVLQKSLHAIATFKQREEQISFFIDFFRSHLDGSSLITPVKDLSSQIEFLKICEEFIQKGINYYWNFPRKQDRDITTTLFFIKVALLVKRWIPNETRAPPIFTDQYIQSFLRGILNEGVQENDVYLCLLLSHENDEKKNENYVEDVLLSWFLMDRHFTKKETVDLHSGIDAKQMVWKQMGAISKILEKSPALCQKVASLIWKKKGNESCLEWKYDPGYRAFYAYSPNGDKIALDLQTRAIRINQADFYTSQFLPSEVLNVPGFKRLFKDRRPSQVQCADGKSFFFTDSVWGEVEVQLGYDGDNVFSVVSAYLWDSFAAKKERIIRKDEKGNQYYFCPDLNPAKDSIPISIRTESILWIPLQSDDLPWSLHDENTGEVLYHLDPALQITNSTNPSWQLMQTREVWHKLEGEGAVLTWKNASGGKRIEYPFLKSRNGQKLSFGVSASGEAYWKENPEYILAPKQQQGLLGTSSQYLLLENKETGKRKILVPMHQMQKKGLLSKFSFFKREFAFSDSEGNVKVNECDVEPESTFFAFDLENDEVIGQTPVENLYLLYLFVTQRNYRLALDYFEKIERRNRFTKSEWKDLYRIIKWMQMLGDETPEASALLLKTWALVNEERKHPDSCVPEEWPEDKISNIFSSYLESTNHRSSIFELTRAEEKEWKEIFAGESRKGVREAQDTQIGPNFLKLVFSVKAWVSHVLNQGSFLFSSSTLWPPSNRSVDRNKRPDLYFLSVLQPEENFYQYYHWIRTGTQEQRETLAAIFFDHLLAESKGSEYLKVLLLACHVKDAGSLPELRDFSTYEGLKANFDHVVEQIRKRTTLTNLKTKSGPSAYLGTQTSAPLGHLKIERGDITPGLEHKEIPLPTVPIPKLTLGPLYFEKATHRYQLKEGVDVASLEQKLTEEIRKEEESLRILEDKILEAAHPESKDPLIRRKEQAAILAGHYSFPITCQALIGLFLEGTYDAFSRACPRSSREEIERLNLDLQTFLINSAYLQQLKRSRNLIQRNMDVEAQNALGSELHAECSYHPTFRPGLVFEVVSNKRLRSLQSAQLQEMVERMEGDHPFLLTHMIMGGGKTDVFASLLGRLWARDNQLALFLTPASQLKTVQGNLASSQWRCFRQGICTFDYQRQDLSLEVLKDIRQELIDAMDNKRLVVLRSEMPQIFELELISQMFESSKDVEKIRALKDIVSIFRKKAAVIIDEADEVFRTDRETNFPSGEKVPLDAQHISFISRIFRILAIDLKGSSTQEKLKAIPALIVKDPVFESIPQKFRESFIRYVSGLLNSKLESDFKSEEIDRQFLVLRDEIAEKDLKTAHLIALARHMVQEILPYTLQKVSLRDFGRLRDDTGKVVPYLAAGVPATTEFGHPWELTAYHFQTALNTNISMALLSRVIEIYFSIAKDQSVVWNCPIEQTPIFHEWFDRFGVSLFDVQDSPGKKELLQKINGDESKKLFIEEKIIQSEVQYDPNYYSSNGHNLMMFPKVLAMTGTPYNRGSYPSILGQKPILDLGSIEELKQTLIRRNGEVHTVEDLTSAEKTLSQVLNTSKSSKHLRSLIDVGGCLLKKSNLEYAKEILTVFANEPTVQGVVFFQSGGGNLALLKKGEEKPIDLIDTHLHTWKAQGVDPNQLFFFYDHLHSRGTDFPLPPKTVALTLLKKDVQLHQILQGVARCRKLMTTQDVIYATQEKDLDIEKIITRSAKLEKDLLQEQIYRHYIQEISHVVRFAHIEELITENPLADRAPAILSIDRFLHNEDPYLLRVSHPISPYHEFGKIPSLIPTIEGIKAHADTILSLYSSRYPSIIKAIHALIEDAGKHLEDLPARVEEQTRGLGREKHLQKQVEKEIEKENERLIELEKEWMRYQYPPRGRERKEASWTMSQANSLANQKGETLDLSRCVSNGPLKTLLNDAWYKNPYPAVFDDNLHATTNWHQSALPIFSQYHKPALQMLVVEHGEEGKKKLSGVLLSLAESEFFRSTWCPQQEKDMRMWLIDADGHLLSPAKSPLPDNAMMDRLLIQTNMLNGHIDWTTKNIDKTISWITEDSSKALVKVRLCYLQAMKEKEKAAILLAHPKLASLEPQKISITPQGDSIFKKIGKKILYFALIVINKWGNMVLITLEFTVRSALYIYRRVAPLKKSEAEI